MPFMTVALVGLDNIAARIAAARTLMPGLLASAILTACDGAVAALSGAAPQGAGGGQPPEGDAPGSLSGSFVSQVTSAGLVVRGVVKTTQPTKLRYVRQGTGVYGPSGQRIQPTTAKALAWPGADHPVRSIAGMPPNDFVSPLMPVFRAQAEQEIQAAAAAIGAALNGG